MHTKRKANEADAPLKKKIKEILHEVEAAQASDVNPQEILQRISFYLQQEASLAIPLIDALVRLPSSQTALLLEEMMTVLKDKGALKAIKRALYRLRQKGVTWEKRISPEKPILRPAQPAAPQGYVGAMDSSGSRVIIIVRSLRRGGARVSFSIVSDLEWIQRLEITDLTKKDLKEFVGESLASAEFPVVEAPGGYCALLLREAVEHSRKDGEPLPKRYEDVERGLSDLRWDGPVPLIYQHIQEEAVEDKPRLLKESAALHRTAPFSLWFLNPEAVRKYAEAIKEAEASHLVLTPQQKDARLNSLYKEALHELFPEAQRLLWKRRLEEMAYILWKMGKKKEAGMAVSAAVDLKTPFSTIEPNPFVWNLLLKSLYALMERERGGKGREEGSSRIITV
ncbi:MAG: hypothetical protein MUP30_00275 [Deltaproteobacteria bacterium]|nr:hypothetical protein [Deltaproteobacteria bacterium]